MTDKAPRMRMSRVDMALCMACFLLILYVLVVLYAMTEDTEDVHARFYRRWALMCQAVARTVGTWGLESELRYRKILEDSRMI